MSTAEMKHTEDGFTVAELVIAASILFFVLTAMIGLMGASSQMTVAAKQRAVLTNVVASYIDEVRSGTWTSIAAPTSPITRVVNGITVVINMTVETKSTSRGTPYLKVLRITATASLQGQLITRHPRAWGSRANITDPDHVLTAAKLRQAFQNPPPRPAPDGDLDRDLADYDHAFGVDFTIDGRVA